MLPPQSIYYISELLMKELKVEPKSDSKSESSPSATKFEAEARRQKKRKIAAFKTFLNQVEPEQQEDLLIKRRLSGEIIEQKLQANPECKICKKAYGQKGKECMFCHDTVCSSHIRKKRRDQTNKFVRICDLCEDSYIYKRYLKNEMKIQETLISQELLLQAKIQDLHELAKGKRTRFEVLRNKAAQLDAHKNKETQRYTTQKTELQRKLRKLQQKNCELSQLQKELAAAQKKLPPSLQTDYEVLVQQDDKITKQLVKYEKWCNDVIKTRSIREKKMYEEYYQWELEQKNKRDQQHKQEECDIY